MLKIRFLFFLCKIFTISVLIFNLNEENDEDFILYQNTKFDFFVKIVIVI